MKFKRKKSVLESEKEAILTRLQEIDPLDDAYPKMIYRLGDITELEEKNKKLKKTVSPDTMALIGANLVGIIVVLAWEEKHVIATKAFGMISKLRL